MNDDYFMGVALEEAEAALAAGEFPVGCVIADSTNILVTGARSGTAGNRPNEVDHAEMVALRNLWQSKNVPDTGGLTVYCTMEPCLMCFGAIILSGIHRIVYGYEDVMGGGTGCDRKGLPPLYRDAHILVVPHVLRQDSLMLFQQFFRDSAHAYWSNSLLATYTLEQ